MSTLKVEVDMRDIWIDTEDEGSVTLQDAMKEAILQEARDLVIQKVREQINHIVVKEVQEGLQKLNEEYLRSIAEDFILNGKFANGADVKTQFESTMLQKMKSYGFDFPVINKVAQELVQNLKTQYDLAFANNIIQHLKQQGLLRDDKLQLIPNGS